MQCQSTSSDCLDVKFDSRFHALRSYTTEQRSMSTEHEQQDQKRKKKEKISYDEQQRCVKRARRFNTQSMSLIMSALETA